MKWNVNNLYGNYQNLLDFQSSWDVENELLLNFSKNDFETLEKTLEHKFEDRQIRFNSELEKNLVVGIPPLGSGVPPIPGSGVPPDIPFIDGMPPGMPFGIDGKGLCLC